MKQTVTHDELVKFAAEKLGIPLKPWRNQWVYPNTIADQRSWIEIDGEAYNLFDLTSWGMMGKGMAVVARLDGMFLLNTKEKLMTIQVRAPQWALRHFDAAPEIPLAFWTAWYELEQQNKQGGVK